MCSIQVIQTEAGELGRGGPEELTTVQGKGDFWLAGKVHIAKPDIQRLDAFRMSRVGEGFEHKVPFARRFHVRDQS